MIRAAGAAQAACETVLSQVRLPHNVQAAETRGGWNHADEKRATLEYLEAAPEKFRARGGTPGPDRPRR